jgi:putative transcriptional regulator
LSTGFFMHPADVTALLRKSGFSISTLADLAGVTRTAVGNVINGRSRSAAIEQLMSNQLAVPLHVLWPQHYAAPNEPEPMRKESVPDPLEALLISEFRKLDLARKARALQLISELAGGGKAQANEGASVVIHGQSRDNQFHDHRGSNAPITVNMGKRK